MAARMALALLAPLAFLGLVEAVLAVAGVDALRYPQGLDRYWVLNTELRPPGYQRFQPRSRKQFPEAVPIFLRDKPANGFRVFVLGES
ncbi:MAG TPA: hypothetical protein VKE69_02765, partial [Planctomycetota bacterium]|nr:hypothetical protein [Planctomycetota bacterium]